MQELACFAPGMLALGSSGYPPAEASTILSLTEELGRTCYNYYQITMTELAGENYRFESGKDMTLSSSANNVRPETAESLFYLWRFTGGWNIFEAFEKNSRVDSGYVGLKDVNTREKDNTMQSFYLAETLEYFYLLYSPPSAIPLDEWVFTPKPTLSKSFTELIIWPCRGKGKEVTKMAPMDSDSIKGVYPTRAIMENIFNGVGKRQNKIDSLRPNSVYNDFNQPTNRL